jgi:hypothetical protein
LLQQILRMKNQLAQKEENPTPFLTTEDESLEKSKSREDKMIKESRNQRRAQVYQHRQLTTPKNRQK